MKKKLSFKELQRQHKQILTNLLRMTYVISYNAYGYYWLHKILLVIPFDWENLLLWFLAMAGQFFFTLENRDKLKMGDYFKDVK